MKTSLVVKELAQRKNLNILVDQMTRIWMNLMLTMPIRLSNFTQHHHLYRFVLLHSFFTCSCLLYCISLIVSIYVLILSFSCSCNCPQKKQSLSTHEKELERLRSEIEEMEKANLEPKTWTMQGEVISSISM